MGVPHIQTFLMNKVDASTTSTTSWDVKNGFTATQTTNVMPWAGVIHRVLVGYSQDIGSGSLWIIHNPNGNAAGRFDGPQHNFVADPSPDVLIVAIEEVISKDDGIFFKIEADGIGDSAIRVTLEVEFVFV